MNNKIKKYRAVKPCNKNKGGLKSELNDLLKDFGYHCFGNRHKRRASNATNKKRCDVLFLVFSQLWQGGFKIESPRNLKPHHVHHLMRRWETEGLSASVISNRFSILKNFAEFIGKPGMLSEPDDYVINPASVRRTTIAKRDKSWTQNSVSPEIIAQLAEENSPYTAAQIHLMQAFGLRLKEAVSFQPLLADHDDSILVDKGTKGGRPRLIPVDSDVKRQALDAAKRLVSKPTQNLCRPGRKIHQEIAHHYYVVRKFGISNKAFGVTPHGLRHEYLNDTYEQIAGHPSPVRGGEIIDKEQDELARAVTMQHAGHGRISIGSSYYGSSRAVKSSR